MACCKRKWATDGCERSIRSRSGIQPLERGHSTGQVVREALDLRHVGQNGGQREYVAIAGRRVVPIETLVNLYGRLVLDLRRTIVGPPQLQIAQLVMAGGERSAKLEDKRVLGDQLLQIREHGSNSGRALFQRPMVKPRNSTEKVAGLCHVGSIPDRAIRGFDRRPYPSRQWR